MKISTREKQIHKKVKHRRPARTLPKLILPQRIASPQPNRQEAPQKMLPRIPPWLRKPRKLLTGSTKNSSLRQSLQTNSQKPSTAPSASTAPGRNTRPTSRRLKPKSATTRPRQTSIRTNCSGSAYPTSGFPKSNPVTFPSTASPTKPSRHSYPSTRPIPTNSPPATTHSKA